jgi:hypothetical protein
MVQSSSGTMCGDAYGAGVAEAEWNSSKGWTCHTYFVLPSSSSLLLFQDFSVVLFKRYLPYKVFKPVAFSPNHLTRISPRCVSSPLFSRPLSPRAQSTFKRQFRQRPNCSPPLRLLQMERGRVIATNTMNIRLSSRRHAFATSRLCRLVF